MSELKIITSPITFGVIIFAIIVDYSRSKLLYRVAEKYDSQALKADALHFSTDILSSSVVLIGLIFSMLGYSLGDPLAAIGVAIIVLVMTINLGKGTVDSLLDRAPIGDNEKARIAAESVEGVISCNKIRIRKSGAITFVDIAIVMNPNLPLETAHSIGESVILEIQKVIDSADVSVHMDPASKDLTPIIEAIREEATKNEWIGDIHEIFAFEFNGKISIGLHIQVNADNSLGEIHKKLDKYKQRLQCIDTRIQENLLNIHIEPFANKKTSQLDLKSLKEDIKLLIDKSPILRNPHDVQLYSMPSGVFVSLHCNTQPTLTIEEVHQATTILEEAISRRILGESHIYIYVEPLQEK